MKGNQKNSAQQKIVFKFFNELFIIQQLASAAFNKVMPDGLHMSQFAAINHLINTGDSRTPVQMANALQVTKATMTHTLNVLEKHGLVEILSNPEDYRSKLVYITKQGRQFQQKAIFALAPTLEKIGNECGIPELSASIPLLEKIRNYMDKERNL